MISSFVITKRALHLLVEGDISTSTTLALRQIMNYMYMYSVVMVNENFYLIPEWFRKFSEKLLHTESQLHTVCMYF